MERAYDMVVFGSTGFTGKFVAEELYRLQCEGKRAFKWAAAGRNKEKVAKYLQESGIEGVDVLCASVDNQDSLESMCGSTAVLINCVGPYQLYGEPVVRACISQQCNYVDITGETYFMESMEAQYGSAAEEAGVYIVNACGFDCIPNDLGALLLQRKFPGQLVHADSFMFTDNVKGFNVGTWESFLRSIRSVRKLQKLRKEEKKDALTFPPGKLNNKRFLFYSDVANRWCINFPGPDKAVVYRSERYRHQADATSPFRFQTYFGLSSLFQSLVMVVCFMFLLLLVTTEWGLNLMIKFPSVFSGGVASKSGASKEQLENATFTVIIEGYGYSNDEDRSCPPNKKMRVKVRGAEPGYIATSAMLVQSALCLLDKKGLPPKGGVLTPAVAFGKTDIVQNIEATGKVHFEVLEQ